MTTQKVLQQTLLQAVLDAPDDDLPRLAYADYLEEQGDATDLARATYIRLQIEAANNNYWPCLFYTGDTRCHYSQCYNCQNFRISKNKQQSYFYGGYVAVWEKDVDPLWDRHLPRLLGCEVSILSENTVRVISNRLRPSVVGWEWFIKYRRGFVSEVTLPLAAFERGGKELVRHWPLERVQLSDAECAPRPLIVPGGAPLFLLDVIHFGFLSDDSVNHLWGHQWCTSEDLVDSLSQELLLWARSP